MMKFLKGVAKEFSPTFNKWDEPSVRDFNGLTVEGRPQGALAMRPLSTQVKVCNLNRGLNR